MSKSKRELNLLVFVCGYVTAGATLGLLYLLNRIEFNVMGLYVLFLIPAGALLTGLVAGSGYGFGSYWTNARVGGMSIWFVLVLGIITFFLAHYVTYRGLLAEHNIPENKLNFVRYLQIECETMTYKVDAHRNPNAKGVELGKFGYLFKLLECLGFAAGGVIPLVVLKAKPYCQVCRRYLKTQYTATMVSEELKTSLKKKKKAEKEAILQAATLALLDRAGPLFEAVPNADYAQNLAALRALPATPTKGHLGSIALELRKCPDCDNHTFIATLNMLNLNGKITTQQLCRINITPNREEA